MKITDRIKVLKILKMFLNEGEEIEDFKVHNNEFYIKIIPKK
jgi:hypothetical protein